MFRLVSASPLNRSIVLFTLLIAQGLTVDAADPILDRVREAQAKFEESIKQSREKVLNECDEAVRVARTGKSITVGNVKVTSTQLLDLSKVIDEEKIAFEKKGLIPLSIQLRAHSATYVRETNAAKQKILKALTTAVRDLSKKSRDEDAKSAQQQLDKLRKPDVVAV